MSKQLESIPASLACPCVRCDGQPMLNGTGEWDRDMYCSCERCGQAPFGKHWTEDNAIDAWNEANVGKLARCIECASKMESLGYIESVQGCAGPQVFRCTGEDCLHEEFD